VQTKYIRRTRQRIDDVTQTCSQYTAFFNRHNFRRMYQSGVSGPSELYWGRSVIQFPSAYLYDIQVTQAVKNVNLSNIVLVVLFYSITAFMRRVDIYTDPSRTLKRDSRWQNCSPPSPWRPNRSRRSDQVSLSLLTHHLAQRDAEKFVKSLCEENKVGSDTTTVGYLNLRRDARDCSADPRCCPRPCPEYEGSERGHPTSPMPS
jgi:hypothetical protein